MVLRVRGSLRTDIDNEHGPLRQAILIYHPVIQLGLIWWSLGPGRSRHPKHSVNGSHTYIDPLGQPAPTGVDQRKLVCY